MTLGFFQQIFMLYIPQSGGHAGKKQAILLVNVFGRPVQERIRIAFGDGSKVIRGKRST